MNPRRVTASNYRTFERLDIDLPTGTVAVTGPNGAGKSSILNLIDIALFADRGELPPLLTVGEDELEIGLEFEHGGELYRIRRQFYGRGRGKTVLDFEIGHSDMGPGDTFVWTPLTRETAAVTQDLICHTLGLSRATFRASSFLAQGDGAAFSEAAPRDRKAVLQEILGLGMWDRLLGVARDELRGCETTVAVSASQVGGLEEQVARMGDVLERLAALRESQAAAASALAAAEGELADAQRAHAAAATLAETVRVCQSELTAATEAHSSAVQAFSDATRAKHELADRTVDLGEAAADAAQVATLEARLEQMRAVNESALDLQRQKQRLTEDAEQRALGHTRLVAQTAALRSDAQTARGKADRLEAHIGEAGDCDRCGQKLGAEAAERAALSYRQEADTLDAKAADLDTSSADDLAEIASMKDRAAVIIVPAIEAPAPVEQALRAARAAAVQAAALTAQVEQLTAKASQVGELEEAASASLIDVAEKQTALDKAQADIPDLAILDSRIGLAQIAVRDTRATVEATQADIVRAEADLERIRDAETRLAAHQSAIADTQARIDVLKLAERAYGRDGIPALILESSAIPQIETEANRILADLGTTYRVELRTQAENKTNANLRETLDVLVYDGTDTRAYETFSGGERTRINLALRLALAGLLATRRGAQSSILCIDEPDGLDAAGMDALATVLLGLSGTFERVLVVSHQPQLGTSFDQRIVIAKGDDGCSRIVEAVEALPA